MRNALPMLLAAVGAVWMAGAEVRFSRQTVAPTVLTSLEARGPAPDVADKMMLFGQLVGDWELDYIGTAPDGSKITTRGEWHFGWVLDGRAVQDVWICPSLAERAKPGSTSGEYGTTIRFYDKGLDAWRVVFIGPAYGDLEVFTARKVAEEIVMEGKGRDGTPVRWIFSDITPQSFHWRAVTAGADRQTWTVREEMFVRRRSS